MATVVNKSQQVAVAGFHPESVYSRIIVVRASAVGGGVYGFGASPTLGQGLWLTRIQVMVQADLGGQFSRCHFSLHRGSGDEPTRQNVQDWEHIIHFGTYAGFRGMVVYGHSEKFSWEIKRRFTNELNRLGVVMFNAGDAVAVVHAFFTVSEG